MRAKRKPKVTDSRTVQRPRIPFVALLRMFLIGSVAVAASAYAIWRHYTVPVTKMLVPVPPRPSATEIEIEPPP